MQKSKLRSVEEVFLVVFFIVCVSLPLGLLLTRGEGTAAWENRPLAEMPRRPLNVREVYRLPRRLAQYFSDHFALRAELIRWQARAKVGWLRSSSSPEVILGKEGWLFHTGEKEIEMFTGAEPFEAEGLEDWRRFLEATRDWSARRGASFVVTFVPEKQTVYPELMPDGLKRSRSPSRLDQLIEHLAARSDLRLIDLRPALAEAKTVGRIYHRTDTHWNDLGVFVAYTTLVSELAERFETAPPLPVSEFELTTETVSGDLANLLGLHRVLKEEMPRLRHKRGARARIESECAGAGQCASEVRDASLPRLVMYRDSASSSLIPLLAEHLERGVYIWDEEWNFSSELLERERPDVVVLEMVERRLMQKPPPPPRSRD